MHHLKLIFRQLGRAPGFTALAILVLALGIGANATIFTMINALVFRQLPVERPQELVGLYDGDKIKKANYRSFSYPGYRDLRERVTTFAGIAAHNIALVGFGEQDTTRRILADLVSANYFSVMGAPLSMGRGFRPEDEDPAQVAPVVILSHQFWTRQGADAAAVGRTLMVNGRPLTIIGVAAAGFSGTSIMFGPDIWVPLGMSDTLSNSFANESDTKLADRKGRRLMLIGRLAPGRTMADANAELAVVSAQFETAFPDESKDRAITAASLPHVGVSTSPMRENLGAVAALFFAMSGVVLLIACLNLANMLLARGAARRKEFAIRLALGGQRSDVVRQLLGEGLVLALCGGIVGLVLAIWANQLLIRSFATVMPFTLTLDLRPDLAVFLATFFFCLLATVLAALGPAWKATRSDLVTDLKDQAGEDRGGAMHGWRAFLAPRNLLVIVQVALSLALLTAAGLFTRSAVRAASANPGFHVESGVLIDLDPSLIGYDEAKGRDIYGRLVARLAALPGVEAVSLAGEVPFGEISLGRSYRAASTDGHAAAPPISAHYNIIGRDYFKAVGQTLLRGRPFNSSEMTRGEAADVAILDDALAAKLWPGGDPVGRYVEIVQQATDQPEGGVRIERRPDDKASTNKPLLVVGVSPTIRHSIFEESPEGTCYVPFGRDYQASMSIHVKMNARAGSDAEAAAVRSIRTAIRELDERVPVLRLKTLRQFLADSLGLWATRIGAYVFTAFGLAALFLAVIGLYGVKSYVVSRRTREIGIRMALGADHAKLVWLIVKQGLQMTLLGLAIGTPIALLAGKVMSNGLYQVSAFDPVVWILVPTLLLAVALLASWVPARRATRVNPVDALRSE